MVEADLTEILGQRPELARRFELRKCLGRGAAGSVYLVRDIPGGRDVALKVLKDRNALDENTLERFRMELEIARGLKHPNLIEAYELIELNDLLAFTMEYVPGRNLAQVLGGERIGLSLIEEILRQLLDAVAALHSRGLTHRDIKLENIILRPDGAVKLSDLGLVKRMSAETLTRTGLLLGTPQYMAPEYIKGDKFDERADIYSIGIVLFELLAGRRRLEEMSGADALDHLLRKRFVLPELPEGVPQRFRCALKRATAVQPGRRCQNVEELRAELQGAPRPTVPVRRRTAPLLMILILLAASAYYVLLRGSAVDPAMLPPGSYRGQLNMYGSTGFMKDVTLILEGEQVQFSSEWQGCRRGVLNWRDSVLHCGEAKNYPLEVTERLPDGFLGIITDLQEKKKHIFTVQLR